VFPKFLVRLTPSLLALLFAGCTTGPEQHYPQAYVAPAAVNLRPQLNQRTGSVTVLKHGDRVRVLDARRRYVKVRSARGAEGWVDALELLSPEEMKRIERERETALKLASEGKATAYETLNIHLAPNRKSPAFTQLPEGAAVDVLARKMTPRLSEPPRPTFTFERPQPPPRRARKERSAKSAKLPPKPAPPKAPADWQHVWGLDSEAETPDQDALPRAKQNNEPEKPAVMESWTLVRTVNKQTGWALTRNLMMGIPDEVAQYAGGGRITSYFDLGAVHDEEAGEKHNWLWTTASPLDPADFTAWRVFLWNRRRHRYETSYRQRELEGYFPVHVDAPDPTRSGRTFQIITKDGDGRMRRRTYLFDGMLVHLAGAEEYQGEVPAAATEAGKPGAGPAAKQSWLARHWEHWKKNFGRGR
jgi:hypothetical protein